MLGHCAQSVGGALPGGGIANMELRTRSYRPGSHTFVAPVDAIYTFYLLGAGGSGAKSGQAGSGGSGGAYARKRMFLIAGTSIPVVVGKGGAFVTGTSAGNAGGGTTVDLPGLRVLANGGAGGRTDGVVGSSTTATGGDTNINGNPSTNAEGGNAGTEGDDQPFASGLGTAGASNPSPAMNGAGGGAGLGGSATVSGTGGDGAVSILWSSAS